MLTPPPLELRKFGLAGIAAALAFGAGPVQALTTEAEASPAAVVRMVTVENAVVPGAESISAALHVNLAEGWKTYWRNPGEVGLPPEVDLSASENVRDFEILWPAPERFTAFGIENFGYSDEVAYPLRILLEEPGEPAVVRADVTLLLCSDICVPAEYQFELTIPAATGTAPNIDLASAELVSRFAEQIPQEVEGPFLREVQAHWDEESGLLTIEARGDAPFTQPDLFPELNQYTAFGAPDIRLGDRDRTIWASIPILSHDPAGDDTLLLTVTDGASATTLPVTPVETAPSPPYQVDLTSVGISDILWIAFIAFLGGLILNVMPCVLPVLSIKLSSFVGHDGMTAGRIRGGFIATAAGVMAFMWVLAATLFTLQWVGVTVGWGLQFQSPVFLSIMIAVLSVFTANLFGLFEITLPSSLQTWMAQRGAGGGYTGDFATGALAAILATPCSAPLLGTAVAFALTGGAIDIAVVFTAMGLGLASPYLAIAMFPSLVSKLPKPGRWMILVKIVLGALLAMTTLWLVWVMGRVAGLTPTIVAVVLGLASVATLSVRRPAALARAGAVAGLAFALVFAPVSLGTEHGEAAEGLAETEWAVFDRAEIARIVSRGGIVFVDVTADWCLTCQANKVLVLDREPVLPALLDESVTTMRADWTRPDESISRYLASFDRYGIPFNAVYGPAAPNGLVLPEVLTPSVVLDALENAGGAALEQARSN